jgi:hypothetical protein
LPVPLVPQNGNCTSAPIVSDFYDEEVDAAVEGLTPLLEPMLMVFLGVIVGFIVVAMIYPYLKWVPLFSLFPIRLNSHIFAEE